ncbi:MAG TPA: FAD-binding oxidoreductase [Myxococcota bacterium]|nr:FAD-binding oxidoreductase [Myxococcota bacterium]
MDRIDLTRFPMTKISGFGRYPTSPARIMPVWEDFEITRALKARGDFKFLARGTGLSYGDASLNRNNVCVSMRSMDRVLGFDHANGIIHVEAGVTLREILSFVIPKGWFLPVTPGTAHPSIGGSVACDVHGKSKLPMHNYIRRLHMILADGSPIVCSPSENPDLFFATVGGMGLTGVITSVELELQSIKSSWVRYEGTRAANLDEIFSQFKDADDWPMTVAWIDCVARGAKLGRSIMMKGRFAEPGDLKKGREPLHVPQKLKLAVPFDFPSFTLNKLTVSAFNMLYNGKHPKRLETIMDYDSFFYPLDAIAHWNRIYGRPGLLQYQFLIPPEQGFEGVKSVLEMIAATGKASFLAVLKKFGPMQNQGLLSFPTPGYFIALDFPYGNGSILEQMELWDKRVLEYGGRLYLTKDARMSRETFRAMYPRVDEFLSVKAKYDPDCVFRSDMAYRLGLVQRERRV